MNDDDRRILEFEERHPEAGPTKKTAIYRELAVSPVRYEQRLGALLLTEEAVAAFPMVANRRMRLADERRGRRLSRSL